MKKLIGPLIFILVALIIGIWQFSGKDEIIRQYKPPKKQTLSLYVGGEKINFLNNARVKAILEDRYGIMLNNSKAGSIEMVTTISVAGKDALWPSNQIAVDFFRKRGGDFLSEQNIFNSPLVLYAYDIVADALIGQNIVELREGSYYVIDFLKLVKLIKEKKSWKSIGLPQLYGNIAIFSTDPRHSNSGNMFCGLLASMLNGGKPVTDENLEGVLDDVVDYFKTRGYMERSSGDIFKNFITTGVGAKPIIVGYENQLVEFAIENEKYSDFLRKKVRTLYPIPTVWSSHPIIALNSGGEKLIEAFKDEEIQKIAWEIHGFRSGLMGVENDPSILKVIGIPKEITSVIAMPHASVMEKIIDVL